MDNYNESFYDKPDNASGPLPKDVKVSLCQQVKSTNFKMAEKKKKALRFIHSEGSADTASTSSAPEENERRLSDYNNEED